MASTQQEYDHLSSVYLPIGIAVAVLVWSVFLFALVRYRRRGEEMPEQGGHLHWVEVGWGIVVAATVAVLLTLTFSTESDVDALTDDPGLEVDVTAFQWGWRFTYPDSGVTVVGDDLNPPTLTVPTDTTVQFRVVSRDVIHAFWIPELRFKRDAFPDRVNEFDLVFDEGTMTGRCAEFCGLKHANMLFGVDAVPPDEFESWLERRQRSQAGRGEAGA